MANDLANILHKILARGLTVLREQAIMPRLVNASYEMEARERGDTIDVPVSTAVTVVDVSPSNTPPAPTDTTPGKVQIVLDNWKQTEGIFLTDKELVEIDANEHFLPLQMGEGIRSLANAINLTIHEEFLGIFGAVGTAGVTPFATTDTAIQARKLLHQQLAPRESRRGVLDFDAEAAALGLSEFADAEKTLSSEVKIEGNLGRKYGLDWFTDDQVVTHTAGTILLDASTRTPTVNGTLSAGVKVMNVDEGAGTTLAGTMTVGDIFTFASLSQTFVVTANASSPQFSSPDYTVALYVPSSA